MSRRSSIVRSTFILSSGIFLSRILGYFRDALIGFFFLSRERDIFFLAFLIPNLSRRLLGEGALSYAFVPIFSDILEKKGKGEAYRFARAILYRLVILLFLLTAIGIVLAPWFFRILGFSPQEKLLGVGILRWMLPFMIFICTQAIFTSILNTLGHFLTPALSFSLFNVSMLLSIILLREKLSLYALAIGVVGGGLLEMLFLIPPLLKRGFRFSLTDWSHPEVRRVYKLLAPALVGFGVFQINLLIDKILASFLPAGSISSLYYSNRLLQIPLALFGISLGMVSLPLLSRQRAREDMESFTRTLEHTFQILIFLTIPSSLFLISLGKPLIRLLFERGNFTPLSTSQTYFALIFYSLGLFFFSGVRILTSTFYSLKKPLICVKSGMWAVLCNLILNLLLIKPLKQGGLALATSLSAGLNLFLLWQPLRKDLSVTFSSPFLSQVWKTLASSLPAFFLALYLDRLWLGRSYGIIEMGRFVATVGTCITVLLLTYHLTGVRRLWNWHRK